MPRAAESRFQSWHLLVMEGIGRGIWGGMKARSGSGPRRKWRILGSSGTRTHGRPLLLLLSFASEICFSAGMRLSLIATLLGGVSSVHR